MLVVVRVEAARVEETIGAVAKEVGLGDGSGGDDGGGGGDEGGSGLWQKISSNDTQKDWLATSA